MKRICVQIGKVQIGGGSPIVVQSMCNTDTLDIEASVKQCKALAEAGSQMIRLTTQGVAQVQALAEIKKRLLLQGIDTPIIADVHFNSEVAIAAAKVADKVRINPGNFGAVHKDAQAQFERFLTVCKEHGTAVRIGLNHGSLGSEIVSRYGNTPEGMKEAVMQWLRMCRKNDFERVVVSLKASNTPVMTQAYRLLYEEMAADGLVYPLHLGVTEAGNADQGRIKSAIGIGALLKDGIGDTIRVSLTENPVNEIPAALAITRFFESGEHAKALRAAHVADKFLRTGYSQICPESTVPTNTGKTAISASISAAASETAWNEFIIRASALIGPLLLSREIDDFEITDTPFAAGRIAEFKDNLLQGARRKFIHPEYIACPGCGRTQYNLEETFNKVKEKTRHLSGVCIAVMGCIVNGPGEMADADYGYVGQGGGKVTIYRGKTPVYKAVPDSEALDLLLQLIEQDKHKRGT